MTSALTYLAIGLGIVIGSVCTWPVARRWERKVYDKAFRRSVDAVARKGYGGVHIRSEVSGRHELK